MKLYDVCKNYVYSRDGSIHDIPRIYELGKFGMQTEFGLDVKGFFKTVLLDVSPNKTAVFPCDYVKYNKIGVMNMHGEISTFKRNDKLSLYHSDYFINANTNAGLPTIPTYGAIGGWNGGIADYNAFCYLNYWYGGTRYNLFGIGSGTADVGQYKVDETNRLFRFAPNFSWSQCVLEYLACDPEEGDDYEVDIRMAEAVKSYLRWTDVVDRPKKASPSAINQLWLRYNNEKRKARVRINPVILNEMQNIERRSWKLVAKA